MGKQAPLPYTGTQDPAKDEEESVHAVYAQIASHFSSTRYKPWPLIESFLHRLPPLSIGLDSGAGNGKYIPVANSAGAEVIAMDRSLGLLKVAKTHGGDCIRGDLCDRSWRRGIFDFAISIAAIHHLTTPERRKTAVQALVHPLYLSSTPPYSRFLIYVWAYEQGKNSKRKMGAAMSNSDGEEMKRDGSEEKFQDVLVPWVLQKPGESSKSQSQSQFNPLSGSTDQSSLPSGEERESGPQVFHRYYHLFAQGELRALVEEAVIEEGFDLVSEEKVVDKHTEGHEGEPKKWCRIASDGWEADNWWIEGEVGV